MDASMQAARRVGAVLLAGACVLAALPFAQSSNQGVFGAQERGCYCHGAVAAPTVGFSVEGLPGRYTPGATYTLWINVTFTDVDPVANRSQGGFYINATAGYFTVPSSDEHLLVQADVSEATHTLNGSMGRKWVINWTAPSAPGLEITFWVYVNTVNGNKSETLGSDHWTMKTIRIGIADDPVVEGPPEPVQHLALETYGALAVGLIALGVMLYLFKTSARPAQPRDDRPRKEGKE